MIKDALGLESQQTEDGAYIPSPTSLKVGAPKKTNYKEVVFDSKNNTNKKVLVLCTEDKYLEVENGKKFSTGNHPVEMFLPILHLNNAGFEVEFCTISGDSVKLEMWAFPEEDDNVKKVYNKYKESLNQPKSLKDLLATDTLSEDYIALFIPGGHGALLGLPDSKEVSSLLRSFYKEDKIISAICHGPAAFLSTNEAGEFLFKDYKITAFPDSADAAAPAMGYLPGDLVWKFGKRLKSLGIEIINALPDNSTHQDRKLITGASPLAAQDLGILLANELLKEVNK